MFFTVLIVPETQHQKTSYLYLPNILRCRQVKLVEMTVS
jgi:hypothetical protein